MDRRVPMVPAEALPAVIRRIQAEEPTGRSFIYKPAAFIELDRMQRIGVGRVPIQKPAVGVGIVKELRIPRARLNGVGLGQHVRLLRARHWQPGQEAIVELHASARCVREHENGHRTRRAGEEIDRVSHREYRRCDDVEQRPARRRDVAPGAQVFRLPVAVTDGFEEVVLAALDHDDGIGAGAIRDALVLLLEVVAVVDVDRIGVRALLGRARHSGEHHRQRRQRANGRRTHSLARRLPPVHPSPAASHPATSRDR